VTDDQVVAVFRRWAEDREHGASEIEEQLLAGLLALRSQWTPHALEVGADLLAGGQAAMAPLIELARRIAESAPGDLESYFGQRLNVLVAAPQALAANALPWIEPAARVVTISRSSAVAAAVEGAWRHGWAGEAVVLDGSGAGRGAEQAQRLGCHGGAVSQPDAAAPRWLDEPRTLVAVGADAVGPDRFVNCIGTRALLELAVARRVTTILVADRGKDVSEEAIDAIVAAVPLHREGPEREWPLFEVVPMDLVTARITD
jgi:translation initiation factor 2B subunit (eIF-2B alpha/beta/delta family)